MTWFSPMALCRTDDSIADRLANGRQLGPVVACAGLWLLAGAAGYGATFGAWRGVEQAAYSALKMPLFIVGLVLVSSVLNVMLAQVLGARLTALQVGVCILLGLSIMTVILLALCPVMAFFAWQSPSPESPAALNTYRALLLANTSVIALAGILGNIRLYGLLRRLTGSSQVANRVLLGWLLTTGLAGSELSWVLSPFLARPDIPVPFLNPNAFTSNFFEYLWHATQQLTAGAGI